MSVADFIKTRVYDHAVQRASAGNNDFPISRWAILLSTGELHATTEAIASALGKRGLAGAIRVEQNDVGNGWQDVGPIRVSTTERNGKSTDVRASITRSSSVTSTLNEFSPSEDTIPIRLPQNR